jgi:hypothetical protein
MLWYLTCVDFSCSILGIKSRNGGSFSTLMLLPDTLQVLENDLVASRQADRSIGSHDFNRLGTGKLCVKIVFCFCAFSNFIFGIQMADNGPPNVCEFW